MVVSLIIHLFYEMFVLYRRQSFSYICFRLSKLNDHLLDSNDDGVKIMGIMLRILRIINQLHDLLQFFYGLIWWW